MIKAEAAELSCPLIDSVVWTYFNYKEESGFAGYSNEDAAKQKLHAS